MTWNGTRLQTASAAPTRVRVLVPAALLAAEGTAQLLATNPSPGGGVSVPVTATIGPPAAAVIRRAPTLGGPPRLGASVSCASGVWSLPLTGIAFSWQRNGVPIPGATDQTYVIVRADLGQRLACVVTATRFGAVARAASRTVRPTVALALRVGASTGTTRTIVVIDRLPWRRATVALEVDRGHGFRVLRTQVLMTGRDVLRVTIPRGRIVLEVVTRQHGQVLVSLPVATRLR